MSKEHILRCTPQNLVDFNSSKLSRRIIEIFLNTVIDNACFFLHNKVFLGFVRYAGMLFSLLSLFRPLAAFVSSCVLELLLFAFIDGALSLSTSHDPALIHVGLVREMGTIDTLIVE